MQSISNRRGGARNACRHIWYAESHFYGKEQPHLLPSLNGTPTSTTAVDKKDVLKLRDREEQPRQRIPGCR
jgi:hypothetical protein